MGLIPKFINEITKNQVIFVKEMGDFYSVVSNKYVNVKTKEVRFKKQKIKYVLDKTDLFNKYGKRIFIKDFDTGKTLSFKNTKFSSLTPDELDVFVSKNFITGFLKMLGGSKYDIVSIVIGVSIGVGLGYILATLSGG